jgi:pimeloyl-ACP methyl ester carboxylesterase
MLGYDRRGRGPPLVLLQSLGADRSVWLPVLDRLAEERDAIAIDLPGFGSSDALLGGVLPAPRELAVAVASFAAGLGLDRPHMAGNSLRVPRPDALRLVRAYAAAPGYETVNAAMRSGRFESLDRSGCGRVAGRAVRPRRLVHDASADAGVGQLRDPPPAGHLHHRIIERVRA